MKHIINSGHRAYTVSTAKGARGRYTQRLTLTGNAAEGFARLTAAMVPEGHRVRIEHKA